jgi:transcriptional regulator GlxA family with amidase domain
MLLGAGSGFATQSALLQAGADPSLAEVTVAVGFSDQGQLTRHFERRVGLTRVLFRISARTA